MTRGRGFANDFFPNLDKIFLPEIESFFFFDSLFSRIIYHEIFLFFFFFVFLLTREEEILKRDYNSQRAGYLIGGNSRRDVGKRSLEVMATGESI